MTPNRAIKMEFRRMLGGRLDKSNAIVSVLAGAGGVGSQDWAQMLQRMYMRWGERHGFKVSILDLQEGEQAGICSAEIAIEGEYVYGYLRSEIGVHRLIRISPLDANARRQTCFASVMVLPDASDHDGEIEINDAELRVDTFQSLVRLAHLPTGFVVTCKIERSQHENMATARRMLMAKLLGLEQQKRDAERVSLEGEKRKIEWGSQIRSYVLHPDQQVNDHRTELKSSAVNAVLDGDLDEFIEAFLLQQSKPVDPT